MVFTKLLLENARAIRACIYEATSESLLPKVARCIPILSSHYIGKCAACVRKRSGSSVHLIVTIATMAEKSVSDHSDQMDTSLFTIPAIVTIITIAIAAIGLGSIPAIASAIVTIAAIIWTQASDRERSERSSYFPRCTAVLVHFMLISISRQKYDLGSFLNDWNDQMDMTQRSFSDRRD